MLRCELGQFPAYNFASAKVCSERHRFNARVLRMMLVAAASLVIHVALVGVVSGQKCLSSQPS